MIKIPNHIAVVPDGNRRWASTQGLKPWLGHGQGKKNLEEILRAVFELKIPCFSFWASSKDNFKKRSSLEIKFLLSLFKKGFIELIEDKDIHKNKVKINIIGDWRNQFPEDVKKPMEQIIERTKNYNKFQFNFMVAYSGTDEMLEAVKKITEQNSDKKMITSEFIKNHLLTKNLPPVDYLIRTGGEPHMSSGFMMWDIADAQLYFSDKPWPDFTVEDFKEAIKEYSKRGRRFGA
ncbi:di-trans,poly-cis-decaprenylcistransferase [Candidatus Parcubacteria bacterium]|nr:di-trans,poly-cis-decaprenylcistransferase [Candidatus Parcubacteria bacterium]